jgi:rubrerythrin
VEPGTTPQAGSRAAPISEVVDGLNDLLQLNHDAVAAYDIAIQSLRDADHADQISGFRRDHERHITELREQITRLGAKPEERLHMTGPLKTGLQRAGSFGGDAGILIAWRINELQVRTKYDRYASKATYWPEDIKRLIDRQALVEERHYEWVVNLLQRMGIGPDDELETRIATRMREAATQLESAVHRSRERVGEAAHRAKNRIAASLDAAAHRIESMERERELGGRAGAVSDRMAQGMHSGARYLRDADLYSTRQYLERTARRYPFRTMVTLFVAGFVLGRIIR